MDQDSNVWRQAQGLVGAPMPSNAKDDPLIGERKHSSRDGSDEDVMKRLPTQVCSVAPTDKGNGRVSFPIPNIMALGALHAVDHLHGSGFSQDAVSQQLIRYMNQLAEMINHVKYAVQNALSSNLELLRHASENAFTEGLERFMASDSAFTRFVRDEAMHTTGLQAAESLQFLLDMYRNRYPEAWSPSSYLLADSAVEAWSRMHEILGGLQSVIHTHVIVDTQDQDPMGSACVSLITGAALIARNFFQSMLEGCKDPDKQHALRLRMLVAEGIGLSGNIYLSSNFFFSSKLPDGMGFLDKLHQRMTGYLYLGYYVSNFFSRVMDWRQSDCLRDTGHYDETQWVAYLHGFVRGISSNPLLVTRVSINRNTIGVARIAWLADRLALELYGREVISSACKEGATFLTGHLKAGLKKVLQEEGAEAALRYASSSLGVALVALDVLTVTLLVYDGYQYATFAYGDTILSDLMIDVQKAEALDREARQHHLAGDHAKAQASIVKAQDLYHRTDKQRMAKMGAQYDHSEQLSNGREFCRLSIRLGSALSEHFKSTHQCNDPHVVQAAQVKLSGAAGEVFNEALGILKQDAMFNKKREGLVSWLSYDSHGIYHTDERNQAIGWVGLAARAFSQRQCKMEDECLGDLSAFEKETAELLLNDKEQAYLRETTNRMKCDLIERETSHFIRQTPAGIFDDPEERFEQLKANMEKVVFDEQASESDIKGYHLALARLHLGRFEWTQDNALKDSRIRFAWHHFLNILTYLTGGDAGLSEKYKHYEEYNNTNRSELAPGYTLREMSFHLLCVNTTYLLSSMVLNAAFRLMALSEKRKGIMEAYRVQVKVNACLSIFKEVLLRCILYQIDQLRYPEGVPHNWRATRRDFSFALRLAMPFLSVFLPTIKSVGDDRAKASNATQLLTIQLALTVASLLCYVCDTLMVSLETMEAEPKSNATEMSEANFWPIVFGAYLILSQCSSVAYYQYLVEHYKKISTGQKHTLGGPSYSERIMTVLNRSLSFNILTLLSPFYFYFAAPDLGYHLTTFRIVHEDANSAYDGLIGTGESLVQSGVDLARSHMARTSAFAEHMLLYVPAVGPATAYAFIAIFLTWLVHSVLYFKPPAYERKDTASKPDNIAGWRSLVDAIIGFNLFAHYDGMASPPSTPAPVSKVGLHGGAAAPGDGSRSILGRDSGATRMPHYQSSPI